MKSKKLHLYLFLSILILSVVYQFNVIEVNASETKRFYATQDAFVVEGNAANFGTNTWLFATQAHGSSFPGERKSFIGGFAIGSIPTDSTIQSAMLCLHGARVSGTSGVEIAVQNVLDAWQENDIHWGNMPDRIYNSNSGTNTINTLSLMQWYSWDIAVYVQDWINGAIQNNGLALIALDSNGTAQFCSTEYGSAYRPYIEITYSTSDNDYDFDTNPVWLNQYFPLIVNNEWGYDGLNISVEGTQTIDGVLTMKVYRSDAGGYIFLSQDEEGTKRFRQEIPSQNSYTIYEPPWKELPANAFVGNHYSYSSINKQYSNTTLEVEVQASFSTDVLGFEDVTLPSSANINGSTYQSFPDCLKLYHEIEADGEVIGAETTWYAKDLGMVKMNNSLGTFYLKNATTYYDSGLRGVWHGSVLDSNGHEDGDIEISINQNGSNLTGDVEVTLDNGESYYLDIENGYASGPNAVLDASDGDNSMELALTHNGNYLTGPYNSNFMSYGTVAPPLQDDSDSDDPGPNNNTSSGGGGSSGGCFVKTMAYEK
jgi:hypothetical protein